MTPRAPWPSITGRSIFCGDPEFRATNTGRTRSQSASEAVERITRETGKNPGTVTGISNAAKRANKSTNPHLHKSGIK